MKYIFQINYIFNTNEKICYRFQRELFIFQDFLIHSNYKKILRLLIKKLRNKLEIYLKLSIKFLSEEVFKYSKSF